MLERGFRSRLKSCRERRTDRPALGYALVVASVVMAGCSGNPRPTAGPETPRSGATETGIASWYGPAFHGRPAASGEVFDMEARTAAHKSLAFDTWVRVDNLDNERSTLVRINDRGPFVRGRIIDVSRAAARELGLIGPGTARVRLTVVPRPKGEPALYSVQAAAFTDQSEAHHVRSALGRYVEAPVFVDFATISGRPHYRVRVGRFGTIQEARAVVANLRRVPGTADAFVVRLY